MFKKATVLACALTLTFAAAAVGCSDDDDDDDNGTTSGINSGVSGDKVASDLTTDEVEQICEAAADYYQANVTTADSCRSAGIVSGTIALGLGNDVESACQEAVDSCISEADPSPFDCTDVTVPDACDATVSELETCIEDMTSLAESTSQEVPECSGMEDYLTGMIDAAGGAGGTAGAEDDAVPQSCQDLPLACRLMLL